MKRIVFRPARPTGELVPLQREDAILATHASDHNAYSISGTDPLRKVRVDKVGKRQKRASKTSKLNIDHEPSFLNSLAIYSEPVSDNSIVSDGIRNEYSWVTVRFLSSF